MFSKVNWIYLLWFYLISFRTLRGYYTSFAYFLDRWDWENDQRSCLLLFLYEGSRNINNFQRNFVVWVIILKRISISFRERLLLFLKILSRSKFPAVWLVIWIQWRIWLLLLFLWFFVLLEVVDLIREFQCAQIRVVLAYCERNNTQNIGVQNIPLK